MDAYKLLALPKAERNRALKVAQQMMRLGIGADHSLQVTVDAVWNVRENRRNSYQELAHIRAAQAR